MIDTEIADNKNEEPDHVRSNTSHDVNEMLDRDMRARVHYYAEHNKANISARIRDLDEEWDIERVLETNAALLALSGVTAAALSGRKRWLIIPGVVLSFLTQHAVQGWCPPIPLFRRLGIRTRKEIEREKYAMKVLRGDFDDLGGPDTRNPERALAAVQK